MPLLALFILGACSTESTEIQSSDDLNRNVLGSIFASASGFSFDAVEICGEPKIEDIIAGQNSIAGTVTVANDDTNLYVSYEVTGDWYMQEVQLYVGSFADVPQKNGNPIPGKFPYKESFSDPAKDYTFIIPLETLTFDQENCFTVAAHSSLVSVINDEVVQTETGWSGDSDFPGRNWALFFSYCVQTCDNPPPPPPSNCETAFMFGNNTFIDLGLTDSRWGWANYFDKVSDGEYTFDFWAGAGQNDTTKGSLAGTITVDVQGTSVNVNIQLNQGYKMTVSHVYFSATDAPNTIAPGQFGNIHENLDTDNDSFNFTYDGSGSFWLVVHAEVCK